MAAQGAIKIKFMWNVVLDSLIDSLIAVPFLLAIYLLIEFLEGNVAAKRKTVKLLNGKCAPLVACGAGLIPQCGFSVMAADLYCQNYLKTGTIIAFFVAASDEALPILLTNPQTVGSVWIVVVVKLVYAVALGYIINLFDRRPLAAQYEEHTEEGCCHHDMEQHRTFWGFVKHPLLHTLKIFIYIFVINTVFGLLLHYFGDTITEFTSKIGFAQSFITAAVGLIPNCASSVLIAGMYTGGVIDFSAVLAGLVSNSGIALAVLFKNKQNIKRNLIILAVIYVAGAALGVASYFVKAAFVA